MIRRRQRQSTKVKAARQPRQKTRMTEDTPPASPPANAPRRKRREAMKKRTAGRPKEPLMSPHKEVLDTLIRQRRMDHQSVAKEIGMKPELFSRSFHGGRNYKAHEAVGLARLLNKSTDEMLRILGHEVTAVGVPLVGKVLPDGRVSPVLGNRKGERVKAARAYPESVAYVFEPTDTVFVVDRDIQAGKPSIPPEAFGRLCIVEAEDSDLPLLGTLEKSTQRGAFALVPYPSLPDAKPRQAKVTNAAVVIAIDRP